MIKCKKPLMAIPLLLLSICVISTSSIRAGNHSSDTSGTKISVNMGIEKKEVKKAQLKHYFYFDQDYGSESQFGPINVFINVGMLMISRFGYSYSINDVDYEENFTNVYRSITDPKKTVDENGGFADFIDREFFPFGEEGLIGAWVANYSIHFIGEGMASRKLAEYFDSKGYNYPKLSGALVMTSAQLMNETIETGQDRHSSTDPLADFFFNIGGIYAFSNDKFASYFSNENLRINYWPGQPVIDPKDGVLFNHGELYVWKIKPESWNDNDWKLVWASGLPNGIGASKKITKEDSFSFSIGFDGMRLPDSDNAGSKKKMTDEEFEKWIKEEYGLTKEEYEKAVKDKEKGSSKSTSKKDGRLIKLDVEDVDLSVNMYWDRNESLMASLSIGFTPDSLISLNIFPGIFKVGSFGVGGCLLTSTSGNSSAVGVTLQYMPVVPGVLF